MDETVKALRLFTHYHNGLLTDAELVGQLAELPREVLELLPDGPTPETSWPPPKEPGIKERALELKTAAERGETIRIFGGITEDEVRQKMAEGSPAAQAISQAVEKKPTV